MILEGPYAMTTDETSFDPSREYVYGLVFLYLTIAGHEPPAEGSPNDASELIKIGLDAPLYGTYQEIDTISTDIDGPVEWIYEIDLTSLTSESLDDGQLHITLYAPDIGTSELGQYTGANDFDIVSARLEVNTETVSEPSFPWELFYPAFIKKK